MSSFTKLTYHAVWSTKYRKPIIVDSFRERLYEYIGGIIRQRDGVLLEIGGIEDHIHLLLHLSATQTVSNAIRDIKANGSRWVNELLEIKRRFEWQKEYSAFTVSYPQLPKVRRYIINQRKHHRKLTFAEEYRSFLKRHDIEFDPDRLFEDEHFG